MQRKSQGPPAIPLDLEIDRTLCSVRRLYPTQEETAEEFFDTSSTSSQRMAEDEDNYVQLFQDFGAPDNYELTSGLALPTTETNYVIHPHYVNMVLNHQFWGAPYEDPIEHLNHFLELCAMVHTNQVTQEYIRMHLFRYSLTGRAYRWLKNLRPNSLTTWAQTASAFLKKFVSEEKTTSKRREISNFQQEPDESMSEAWEKFHELTRSCPNHEFTQNQLMQFFYDSLEPLSKSHLNAGGGGQILKVPQDQLQDTIEEVVRDCSWGGSR